MKQVLVIAEWSANFSEHFAPLVDEIRRYCPCVSVHALLHRVKFSNSLSEPECSTSAPFDTVVVTEGKEEFASTVIRLKLERIFTFIKHTGSSGDVEIYYTVSSLVPEAVFLLTNIERVAEFFLSGRDQSAEISDICRRHNRRAREIWFKIRLLWVAWYLLQIPLSLLALFRVRRGRHRILFMRLDVLGDMVLSLPALRAIRASYSESEITVLASARSGSVINEQQQIQPGRFCNKLLSWQAPWHEQKEMLQGLKAFVTLFCGILRLCLHRYDIIVQPVELGTGVFFATLLRGKLTVATIAERLPLARMMRSKVEAVRVSPYRLYHIADLPRMVADRLGCKDVLQYCHDSLLVSDQALASVIERLAAFGWDSETKLIAVNIGAGSPKRTWNPQKTALLIRQLRESGKDLFPVIVGGKGESELDRTIALLMEESVPSLVGELSLNELIAFLSVSEVVVTPDTGVMHIAAALDRKVVAIYGAGLVPFCRPLCSNYVIVKQEMGCSGCGDLCYAEGEPPCISAISVSMVFESVQALLKK